MRRRALLVLRSIGIIAVMGAMRASAQQSSMGKEIVKVVLRAPAMRHAAPAVIWLSPLQGTPALPFVPHGGYKLLQKNRAFAPHLQVVPVGAVVQFPNADPFFHNVFSMFDGQRFDLGLYEAGSSKAVTFSREGVSYLFCNIHPEMSAVILTLETPLYATGRTGDTLVIDRAPPGEYELRVWVEGVKAGTLEALRRHLHLVPGIGNQVEITVHPDASAAAHKDKFGKDYGPEPRPSY
jgi:hypothetical protein